MGRGLGEKEEEEKKIGRRGRMRHMAWLCGCGNGWEWVGVWVRGSLSLILIKQNTELSEKDDTFTAF